jgi:hypothetical protein
MKLYFYFSNVACRYDSRADKSLTNCLTFDNVINKIFDRSTNSVINSVFTFLTFFLSKRERYLWYEYIYIFFVSIFKELAGAFIETIMWDSCWIFVYRHSEIARMRLDTTNTIKIYWWHTRCELQRVFTKKKKKLITCS